MTIKELLSFKPECKQKTRLLKNISWQSLNNDASDSLTYILLLKELNIGPKSVDWLINSISTLEYDLKIKE